MNTPGDKEFMCLTTHELDTVLGWGRCVNGEYGLTGREKPFYDRLWAELMRRNEADMHSDYREAWNRAAPDGR